MRYLQLLNFVTVVTVTRVAIKKWLKTKSYKWTYLFMWLGRGGQHKRL